MSKHAAHHAEPHPSALIQPAVDIYADVYLRHRRELVVASGDFVPKRGDVFMFARAFPVSEWDARAAP